MKVKVILLVIGALGTTPIKLRNWLKEIGIEMNNTMYVEPNNTMHAAVAYVSELVGVKKLSKTKKRSHGRGVG